MAPSRHHAAGSMWANSLSEQSEVVQKVWVMPRHVGNSGAVAGIDQKTGRKVKRMKPGYPLRRPIPVSCPARRGLRPTCRKNARRLTSASRCLQHILRPDGFTPRRLGKIIARRRINNGKGGVDDDGRTGPPAGFYRGRRTAAPPPCAPTPGNNSGNVGATARTRSISAG